MKGALSPSVTKTAQTKIFEINKNIQQPKHFCLELICFVINSIYIYKILFIELNVRWINM